MRSGSAIARGRSGLIGHACSRKSLRHNTRTYHRPPPLNNKTALHADKLFERVPRAGDATATADPDAELIGTLCRASAQGGQLCDLAPVAGKQGRLSPSPDVPLATCQNVNNVCKANLCQRLTPTRSFSLCIPPSDEVGVDRCLAPEPACRQPAARAKSQKNSGIRRRSTYGRISAFRLPQVDRATAVDGSMRLNSMVSVSPSTRVVIDKVSPSML